MYVFLINNQHDGHAKFSSGTEGGLNTYFVQLPSQYINLLCQFDIKCGWVRTPVGKYVRMRLPQKHIKIVNFHAQVLLFYIFLEGYSVTKACRLFHRVGSPLSWYGHSLTHTLYDLENPWVVSGSLALSLDPWLSLAFCSSLWLASDSLALSSSLSGPWRISKPTKYSVQPQLDPRQSVNLG